MTSFIRWAMGIHLTKDELKFIKPYTDAVGIWLGLMNDFMSWKRERTQPTDRIINSVMTASAALDMEIISLRTEDLFISQSRFYKLAICIGA